MQRKTDFFFVLSSLNRIFAGENNGQWLMSDVSLINLRDYLYSVLSKNNMLWLATQLTQYAEQSDDLKPYTMEEIDIMLDEAEHDLDAGVYLTNDDVFRRNHDEVVA